MPGSAPGLGRSAEAWLRREGERAVPGPPSPYTPYTPAPPSRPARPEKPPGPGCGEGCEDRRGGVEAAPGGRGRGGGGGSGAGEGGTAASQTTKGGGARPAVVASGID